MRNQSRFLLEDKTNYLNTIQASGLPGHLIELITAKNSSIGLQPIQTMGTQSALAGKTNFAIFPNYRGIPILSAYAPITHSRFALGHFERNGQGGSFSTN